jgi:tripartite ATP-independent transporter DctM subunit
MAALVGTLIPLLIFAGLLVLGVPVFVAMGLGSIAFIQLSNATMQMTLFADTLYSGLSSFALIAVPLFIFTGDAIFEVGVARELLDFVESLVGGLKTGFGSATILGCGLFATISGSNASDAAAIGRITLGRLYDTGYSRNYAAAMVASGASTGVLIPPSISYIIAGIILGVPASTLFLAAFIPGVLILFSMVAVNVVVNRSEGYESGGEFQGAGEILRSGWEAKFGLLIPIIILGGIYSGVFTPTEAAAVAVGVTLLIGLLYSTIALGDFSGMYKRSAILNGIISPNIAVGIVFSQVISVLGLPSEVAGALFGTTQNFYIVTLLMIFFFLVAGAIIEITPNIIILGPLFAPLASEIGMDPVHYTVVLISALGVGFITPPIGLNLYVLSGISGESVLDVARSAVPFMISMLIIVVVLAWFPGLFMWLV